MSMAIVTIFQPLSFQSPLSLRMSSWPAKPCMTAPQARKSVALKKACVSTW